jgi:intracellular sulfur oxidation DsrE/DsrF family protein
MFAAFALLALVSGSAGAAEEAKKPHRLVVHVDENDEAKLNLALNNVVNVTQYYNEKGAEVEVEVVAYGPGLHMLRADTSRVKQRILSFGQSMPNVVFSACGNTMDAMKKAEGKEIDLLPKVRVVPAGVTRIMELQEQGWST